MKKSNNIYLKQKYDGKTQPNLVEVNPEIFGMKRVDNWYGGNLKRAAIVRDTSVVLLMTSELKTIDVAYIIGKENEVPEEDCKYFGIEVVHEDDIPEEDVKESEKELTKHQLAAIKAAETRARNKANK